MARDAGFTYTNRATTVCVKKIMALIDFVSRLFFQTSVPHVAYLD
jgi:hypothetical protein